MTRRPRMLRWEVPETPPPAHPYRDTLFVYAGFSVIIVLVSWATGGSITHAIEIAVVFFVVACGWSWWRWRQKLAQRAALPPDDETQL